MEETEPETEPETELETEPSLNRPMQLEHRDMPRGIPSLFFANKKDLPMSLPPQECAKSLRLDSITNRPWQIWHCNALSGEGVATGNTWLADAVKKAPKK